MRALPVERTLVQPATCGGRRSSRACRRQPSSRPRRTSSCRGSIRPMSARTASFIRVGSPTIPSRGAAACSSPNDASAKAAYVEIARSRRRPRARAAPGRRRSRARHRAAHLPSDGSAHVHPPSPGSVPRGRDPGCHARSWSRRRTPTGPGLWAFDRGPADRRPGRPLRRPGGPPADRHPPHAAASPRSGGARGRSAGAGRPRRCVGASHAADPPLQDAATAPAAGS